MSVTRVRTRTIGEGRGSLTMPLPRNNSEELHLKKKQGSAACLYFLRTARMIQVVPGSKMSRRLSTSLTMLPLKPPSPALSVSPSRARRPLNQSGDVVVVSGFTGSSLLLLLPLLLLFLSPAHLLLHDERQKTRKERE